MPLECPKCGKPTLRRVVYDEAWGPAVSGYCTSCRFVKEDAPPRWSRYKADALRLDKYVRLKRDGPGGPPA